MPAKVQPSKGAPRRHHRHPHRSASGGRGGNSDDDDDADDADDDANDDDDEPAITQRVFNWSTLAHERVEVGSRWTLPEFEGRRTDGRLLGTAAGGPPRCTQAVLTLAPAPLPFLPASLATAAARGTFATLAVPLAEHGDRLLWVFEIERVHWRSALVPACLASEWEGGGVGFEAAFVSDRGDRSTVAAWRAV